MQSELPSAPGKDMLEATQALLVAVNQSDGVCSRLMKKVRRGVLGWKAKKRVPAVKILMDWYGGRCDGETCLGASWLSMKEEGKMKERGGKAEG